MNTFFIIWVVVLTICIGIVIYDLCSVEKLLSNLHKRNKELSDYYFGLQGFTFTHIARLENPPKFKHGDKVLITHHMSNDLKERLKRAHPDFRLADKEVATVIGMKYKEMDDYLPTYTCVTEGGETREVFEKNLALYVEQPEQKHKTKKK